ncbi:MAG: sigma-54-dependent Fis family transcriptional regulator [Gammaproteobacteria bacterium]|nr:sigma-54-dependent Fis family transcriptional regulator [Gammaproteobacteria bacterium]
MTDQSDKVSFNKPSCEQLIDIFPDPFVIIDKDYTIIAANQAYQNHYHIDDGRVVGKHCHEVSHHSSEPCSHHGEQCPLEEVFSTGQPTKVMHLHYDTNGKEEFVQLQAAPILSNNGEVMFIGEYVQIMNTPAKDTELLIGRSPAFMRLLSLLQRVAPTSSTVLLLGESGVGKECVAEYIHHYSKRASCPFVVVDCGTLGENLIESELFGHEKGAFTGANRRKQGLFEVANGGTLFIDELCELPLALQTKLLRVLETGTIRRLGGNEYIKIDVRIIAATNRNIQEMVSNNEFRQDLYYRLSAFPIKIPPLRERKDDIVPLAESFLAQTPEGESQLPLSVEVIETLLKYNYPGNIRELRNIIERALILAYEDVLRPEHIVLENDFDTPPAYGRDMHHSPLPPTIIQRKGRLKDNDIIAALQETHGHRSKAAYMLGISERTLYRHMQRLRDKLPEDQFKK